MQCIHYTSILPYVFLSNQSFRLLLVQGEGWCPRKRVCLRSILRPWCFFQTKPGPEMQTGMGSEPVSSYLTLRIGIRFFFWAGFTWLCLGGTDHTVTQSCVVAPKMQQQFEGNECYPKSTNTSHARKVCMQSVKAFPALLSSSWLVCPLKLGTCCSLH